MTIEIISETGIATCSLGDAHIKSRDLNSWPEAELRGLEMTLASGHLELLDVTLSDGRTRRVLALNVPEHETRIQAVRDGLAFARMREVRAGGPGSLIDPAHPLTIAI